MPPSEFTYPTKKLILNLVKAADQPISASMLINMASIFDIESNAVRVALNRMVSNNFLNIAERGVYELGEAARAFAVQQREWRNLEFTTRPWDGQWIAIYVAHLGRRDRKQLRRRERAATMLGFAALNQGLLIRPNNLRLSIEELTQQLRQLGLEQDATVFKVCDFNEGSAPVPEQLWPLRELETGYRRRIERMQSWRADLSRKTQEEAARESFLIGDEVLRSITYDPRLPKEMLNTELRQQMISEMSVFDEIGKQIWLELMKSFLNAQH